MSGRALDEELRHPNAELFSEPPEDMQQESTPSKKKQQSSSSKTRSHSQGKDTWNTRYSEQQSQRNNEEGQLNEKEIPPTSQHQNEAEYYYRKDVQTTSGYTTTRKGRSGQVPKVENPQPPLSQQTAPPPQTTQATPVKDQLRDLKMLFPNHSEDELRRVLAEAGNDLDEAITVILGQDNLANAPSADELQEDLDAPKLPEIIGELKYIHNCIP